MAMVTIQKEHMSALFLGVVTTIIAGAVVAFIVGWFDHGNVNMEQENKIVDAKEDISTLAEGLKETSKILQEVAVQQKIDAAKQELITKRSEAYYDRKVNTEIENDPEEAVQALQAENALLKQEILNYRSTSPSSLSEDDLQ